VILTRTSTLEVQDLVTIYTKLRNFNFSCRIIFFAIAIGCIYSAVNHLNGTSNSIYIDFKPIYITKKRLKTDAQTSRFVRRPAKVLAFDLAAFGTYA